MSTRQDEVIQIQQTLHGYADGHRLLESSWTLPREVERAVLVLSDMSGPSMLRGFESYLTGYPLPDAGVYALARTWYAAEMPRPGCVWTHTLFIEHPDLARIRDLRTLVRLFCRPERGQAWSAYRTPLTLSALLPYESDVDQDRFSEIAAAVALAVLYGSPDSPIYIPADTSMHYEHLILSIWTQQWPRLRRIFRFCTGSLANRTIASKVFDIQVVPFASIRQIRRGVQGAEFVSVETSGDSVTFPAWIKAATDDLLAKTPGLLRQFLWEFGAEIKEGRGVFARFVEIFTCLEGVRLRHVSVANVLETIGLSFPGSSEATTLKIASFGAGPNRLLLPELTEWEVLRALTTTEYYGAFDADTLDMRGRAKAFWHIEPEHAKNLIGELGKGDLTPLGTEFLAGISEALEPTDAVECLKVQPELLSILGRHNPSMVAFPQLWSGSSSEQRTLWELVENWRDIPHDILKAIVSAMLEAGVSVIAGEVVERLGQQAVNAILDWVDMSVSQSPQVLTPVWRRALASWPSGLLSWLRDAREPRAHTVALVAGLLDPHASEVQCMGTTVWLQFATTAHTQLDRPTLTQAMAFLLAFAFDNPGPGAAELVAKAFEIVHDAARHDELDNDSWRLLMDQVPSSFWGWDWDRCERLRRALADRFVRYDWPIDQFLRVVKDEKTFFQIVEYCSTSTSGRSFLRKIMKLVAQGECQTTSARRAVLASFL
jgi:hypothetical protein